MSEEIAGNFKKKGFQRKPVKNLLLGRVGFFNWVEWRLTDVQEVW